MINPPSHPLAPLAYTYQTTQVRVKCHMSGMPDMLMTLVDPSVIEDCSFHPCVRYGRFDKDKVISFVPPDGNFTLMNYRVTGNALNSPFRYVVSVGRLLSLN
jgi:hypothetical protein